MKHHIQLPVIRNSRSARGGAAVVVEDALVHVQDIRSVHVVPTGTPVHDDGARSIVRVTHHDNSCLHSTLTRDQIRALLEETER